MAWAASAGLPIDQQGIGECTEGVRGHGHAPGRIELAVLNEAPKRLTAKIEGVYDPVTLSCHVVVFDSPSLLVLKPTLQHGGC
jgi:hypothetical protein